MKIFFAGSQRGKKFYGQYYIRIYELVAKNGYEHLDKSFIETTTENFYDNLDKGGRQAHVDFYNRNIKNIKEADICIFECSLHSLSIGFQIEKALEFNKPTIVLYLEKNTPYFLGGIENDKMIVYSYDKENLENILTQALDEAKEVTDKRFNFFISPHLLNYLNKAATEEGITKSTFIRNLLLDHMKKNKSKK